jgi:hypothetical protein
VQHLDDYEEPPSLVTSSGYNTSGYQFPYYLEGTDQMDLLFINLELLRLSLNLNRRLHHRARFLHFLRFL